jgi:hypothetical protein
MPWLSPFRVKWFQVSQDCKLRISYFHLIVFQILMRLKTLKLGAASQISQYLHKIGVIGTRNRVNKFPMVQISERKFQF